jgi:serine/threonine-protein kinase
MTTEDSPIVDRDDVISEDSPTVHRESLDEDSPTVHKATPRRRNAGVASSTSSGGSSSGSFSHGRFLPGQVLGGRFRIIAILGKGGMGEVYRADDLTLGQPVALKFLPEDLAGNTERLDRFRAEVRMARQVAHPNVCKVYDIGEIDGEYFLSMEYVEGEDLAHLLKRIGALPQGKAIQIARQIAAGLAAAHDKGLIHRDLKPANVMLDERGTVRVTDFGLAGTAEDFTKGNIREGTPQYMAPEQLRGESVTPRSDIYSLGLVLYEIFTGKKAFDAPTIAKLMELRESSTASDLSNSMENIDPTIERVILRCVEEDPAERPSSALAVAAALPGGDPLAAAIAAGETPSPEMVAAAGDEGLLKPVWAIVALAFVIAICAVAPFIGGFSGAIVDHDLEYPPAVLESKAREMLARLGYEEKPADSKGGYFYNGAWLRHIEATDESPDRWDRLGRPGPPVFAYWYRESPEPLVNFRYFSLNLVGGDVTPSWPAADRTGMLRVVLTADGKLDGLLAHPPQFDEEPDSGAYDWTRLLNEAGYDIEQLTPTEPQWVPPYYAHERRAWLGVYEGEDAIPVRIEAARYGDKPVYFAMVDPWTKPTKMTREARTARQIAGTLLQMVIFAGIIVGSIILARRNIRMGRGDRRGAFRLAMFEFAGCMAIWLFGADHVASFKEFGLLWIGLSWSLVISTMVWLLYVALEPFLRRRWPTMLISWSRLLGGRFSDPLVGRDALIGAATGAGITLLVPYTAFLLDRLRGKPTPVPVMFHLDALGGNRAAIHAIIDQLPVAAAFGFMIAFLLLAFRLLLKKEWLALGAVSLVTAILSVLTNSGSVAVFIWPVVWIAIFTVLVRFGLFAATVTIFVTNVLDIATSTPGGVTSWTAAPVWMSIGVTLLIAVWGFLRATAGRWSAVES